MIGRLRGTVIEKSPPSLVVDVHGVGYEVVAPMSTFYRLPEVGQEVVLFTQMVVREDAQLLYGFANTHERELFRQLIKVTGVGAKMSIAILSGMSPQDFVYAVQSSDLTALTRIPGVGRKTAERLVVEMRDRFKDSDAVMAPLTGEAIINDVNDAVADAVSALVALGYKPQEASRWVRRINSSGMAREEIIRQALQLASGGSGPATL